MRASGREPDDLPARSLLIFHYMKVGWVEFDDATVLGFFRAPAGARTA